MATFEQNLKLIGDFATWDRGTCEHVRDELIPFLKNRIKECEDCDSELIRVGEPAMFASNIEEWKRLIWSAIAKLMSAGYVTPIADYELRKLAEQKERGRSERTKLLSSPFPRT